MRKSTIIRFVKNNIEKYGSFCNLSNCKLCAEAQKRMSPPDWLACKVCPLWDYIPKPKCRSYQASCANLKYNGKALFEIEMRLEGNKPALRALLNGLIKHFDKED